MNSIITQNATDFLDFNVLIEPVNNGWALYDTEYNSYIMRFDSFEEAYTEAKAFCQSLLEC